MARKYDKCVRCERTIDVTNQDRDLCNKCSDSTGVRLSCNRCKHEWDYKGDNEYYATCPHCLTKVRVVKK